ncbi:MAG: hypothetical protein AAF414_13665 [Pseudomonadota bacterium]
MGRTARQHRLEDLGPRHEIRLSDLHEWHIIRIRCQWCGRSGQLYPSVLKKRYQTGQRLIDLERRLRCKSCGNTDGNIWRIYRLPRD